jgi:hypothetical protein
MANIKREKAYAASMEARKKKLKKEEAAAEAMAKTASLYAELEELRRQNAASRTQDREERKAEMEAKITPTEAAAVPSIAKPQPAHLDNATKKLASEKIRADPYETR